MSFKALTRIEQQLLQSSRHVLKQATCSKRGVMLSSADEDIPEPDRTITKTEVALEPNCILTYFQILLLPIFIITSNEADPKVWIRISDPGSRILG